MPFSGGEIQAGHIAYFTIDELRSEPTIDRTGGSPDSSARPFACYATEANGRLYWTPLTTQATQDKRVGIKGDAILGAVGLLATESIFVNDAGHTYAGLSEVFARLSERHDRSHGTSRPRLTPGVVAEIIAAVRQRGGLRPDPTKE